MLWNRVKYIFLALSIFKTYASDDWTIKFEGLKEALSPTSSAVLKDVDLVQVLNEVAKCATSQKDRLSTLSLIPGWFQKTQSMYVTTGIRSALRFLIETAESVDEKQKQIEILEQLSIVTRTFPPSMEDESNLREVRDMLCFLANNGKNINVSLSAIECSMQHSSFPWASRDTRQLVPILRSFLEGDSAIRDNLKAKAKAISYLSQLIDGSDSDFVIEILQSAELASPDVTLEIAESYRHLSKIAAEKQGPLLRENLEVYIKSKNRKIRLYVAEGLRFLAEKSEDLGERQHLRIALSKLAKDEDADVVLEVGVGFEYLARKAKEAAERKSIQDLVQALLQNCAEDGKVRYGAIAAYRELIANSESSEERRVLREIVPSFFTYIGTHGYWLASSVCKTFCEKAIESEERLFFGQKLSEFFTDSMNTYSDISYDIAFIFSSLASKVETKEERLMVLDVLTRPNCLPTDAVNMAIASMHATDCKSQVQAFVESSLKKMEAPANRGMTILKLLSQNEQSGANLEWIKTVYINTITANSPGAFWYVQEEAIAGCKKLCEKISNDSVKAKIWTEFDVVINAREERLRAKYEEYSAEFGSFPGDD